MTVIVHRGLLNRRHFLNFNAWERVKGVCELTDNKQIRERRKEREKKNLCPVFLKKMDFKESCNLHILSLSFVWYSCSFYLIMLWGGGGVWKSINKCSNDSLTCLALGRFVGLRSFPSPFWSPPYLPHRTRSYRDSSENLSSDLLRVFHEKHFYT